MSGAHVDQNERLGEGAHRAKPDWAGFATRATTLFCSPMVEYVHLFIAEVIDDSRQGMVSQTDTLWIPRSRRALCNYSWCQGQDGRLQQMAISERTMARRHGRRGRDM